MRRVAGESGVAGVTAPPHVVREELLGIGTVNKQNFARYYQEKYQN